MHNDLLGGHGAISLSPDYLVVQCWVYSTFFYPDTINPTGLHVYCYAKFFEGIVGYNSMGIPWTQLMAVISYANAKFPFVLTAFSAL